MACSSSSALNTSCNQISDAGPSIAFSAGCVLRNTFYVHGGICKTKSTKPCKDLYKLCLIDKSWELANSAGPSLSHHGCVLSGARYIIFIGGWTGKERSSDVYVYDCEANNWIQCQTTGFPVGAGLSSHTANLLSNGEIVVIGREGSVRMQRRSGNAFILSGSASSGEFSYREMAMAVASRSGHTTSCLQNSMVIVGGRSDKLFEIHKVPHALSTSASFTMQLSSPIPTMTKLPCCRKNHSATVLGHYILIFGGETFDGKSKEPVQEIYIIDSKENYSWKYLGKTSLGRAGHIAAAFDNSIVIHGGVGEKNVVSNLTYQLKLS